MPDSGASYYEVLTSDLNLAWRRAADLHVAGIEESLVITGNYQISEKQTF